MRFRLSGLCVALGAFALSGCASDMPFTPACPQVAIIRDLERFEDYGQDTLDPANLVAVAQMMGVEGECSYENMGEDSPEGRGVEVFFDLALLAEKTPRLGSSRLSVPYFVSIVSPTGGVTAKELSSASFEFAPDKAQAEKIEKLNVFIPLYKGQKGQDWRVLMGFQLNEAQLKALRARKTAP